MENQSSSDPVLTWETGMVGARVHLLLTVVPPVLVCTVTDSLDKCPICLGAALKVACATILALAQLDQWSVSSDETLAVSC